MLRQPDGRVHFAGDYMTNMSSWMQGAFESAREVATAIGAGGSANTQEVALGTTPLRLRIGSMVSFQADGRLFDGHGVTPDVRVEPTPEYYIGEADVALAEAVKRVKLSKPSANLVPTRER